MKKIILIFILSICYLKSALANTINIINSTSGQISITLQTNEQTITQSIFPSQSQFLKSINNPIPTPTVITYNGLIQKITIQRLSTNMPQVIYYTQENTIDNNQNIAGIAYINATKQGFMQIWPTYVEINKFTYAINDLSSYIVRRNKLRKDLNDSNIDQIQSQIDEITNDIKNVQDSDEALQIAGQITIIQSGIDAISHNIQIIKILNKDLQTIQDLESNLAKDTINQTQETLQNLQNEVQAILNQYNLHKSLYNQAMTVQNSIDKLQNTLEQFNKEQQATNTEILVN